MSVQIPITEHDCDAKLLEWKHHRVNDKPCVAVLFGILSGPLRGRRVEWTAWMTAAAIELSLRQLQAAGWKGGSLRTLDGLGSVNVSLRIEPEALPADERGPARVFPRVAWVNKIRNLAHATGLSDRELEELDKLAAKVKANPTKKTAKTDEPGE